MDYQDRIERGAALLDEKVPGWDKLINLDTLAMSSCTSCIVGQVMLTIRADEIGMYYQDNAVFRRGLSILGIPDDEYDDEEDEYVDASAYYGFNLTDPEPGDWQDLGATWKQLILERRATA